jgi:hypothetical protein
MRKLAIALVAAITVGAAVPAVAAVSFHVWPGGIGVGVGPDYYGGPYWHHRHYWHHHHYVRSW